MKIRIRKDLFFISLLLLISIFFLFPILPPGFYETHDGEAHVARFAAYYQAFQDGQFPPRWAGNLNFGYGTPIFIFYYPLPGWIASLLHLFGISFENAFKILIGTSFVAAPVTFYLWAKELFRKEIAFGGALVYGLAPYHFLNLYVRGDVAELLALAFVPLVVLSIEKILKRNSRYIVLGGIFYGLLLLSHNGISLMFSPLLFVYCIARSKTKKQFLQAISLFLLGLALSAFFWLPALYESKYTNANLFIGDMYKKHFPTPLELITSPWGFGPNIRDSGGLSPQLGILPVLFVLGSVLVFLRDRRKNKALLGWLLAFSFAIFMALPVASFIWEMLPLVKKFEFPWRFIGLASFVASVLACYFFSKVRFEKIAFLLFLAIILMAIPLAQVKKYVSYEDSHYENFSGTTDYHGAASSPWTVGDPDGFAKSPVEIIGGTGTITNLSRKTNEHRYLVDAETEVQLLDNTHYYPGWRVSVDGKDVPIQFQDAHNAGLISFVVPEGDHIVLVSFTETILRTIVNDISFITGLIIVCLFFFWQWRRK